MIRYYFRLHRQVAAAAAATTTTTTTTRQRRGFGRHAGVVRTTAIAFLASFGGICSNNSSGSRVGAFALLLPRTTTSFAPASTAPTFVVARRSYRPVTAGAAPSNLSVSNAATLVTSPLPVLPTAAATRLMMSSSKSDPGTAKPGVASPDELRDFVAKAGDDLLVVDLRNADADAEPGDQKSFKVAGLPGPGYRPRAVNLVWDRESKSMPLPDPDVADKDTPIITHCGGGGRGQLGKEYLEARGYTNVLNGGGPKETECWAVFGDK